MAAGGAHVLCQCDSSSSMMRASGKLKLSSSMGTRAGQVVHVQGGLHTVTLAAEELLVQHLTDATRNRQDAILQPLNVSFDGDKLAVEFPLPARAEVTAVFGHALRVSSLATQASTPFQRFFGERTLRDVMQGAEFDLVDGVHKTTVTVDGCDVMLLRDVLSGTCTLRLLTSKLEGTHARALAKAYEVAHEPPQPMRPADEALSHSHAASEPSMECGGGSA